MGEEGRGGGEELRFLGQDPTFVKSEPAVCNLHQNHVQMFIPWTYMYAGAELA